MLAYKYWQEKTKQHAVGSLTGLHRLHLTDCIAELIVGSQNILGRT